MSGLDLRPPVGALFDAFGVAATVTPKIGNAITTTAVWHPTHGAVVGIVGSVTARGSDQVPDLRPRLSLRRDQVATLQVGSTISAPTGLGGSPVSWRVERVNDLDADVLDVVVEAV